LTAAFKNYSQSHRLWKLHRHSNRCHTNTSLSMRPQC
jgi:hypothetical protein